jgi:hypothetical protein
MTFKQGFITMQYTNANYCMILYIVVGANGLELTSD